MTKVCLLGSDGVDVRAELLSRETSRRALSSYQLQSTYANTLVVETISVGAAVSLLNDLNWYLVRFVEDALVHEPSVSENEWLSRDLATAIRDNEVDPADTGTLLKIYGVADQELVDGDPSTFSAEGTLVEPMYAQRVGGETPSYDLADVEDTVVVRVTQDEFGG